MSHVHHVLCISNMMYLIIRSKKFVRRNMSQYIKKTNLL